MYKTLRLSGMMILMGFLLFSSASFINCMRVNASQAETVDKAGKDQMIVVVGTGGSKAVCSFDIRQKDGSFKPVLVTNALVGTNGITDKKREGDLCTPAGVYDIGYAFGILKDPRTAILYRQVKSTDYYVDDASSAHYNKWVDIAVTPKDFNSAEHLIDICPEYDYALYIDYNDACVKGAGSGIFMHCMGAKNSTSGCVSVPQDVMKKIVQMIKPGARIMISGLSQ